MTRKGWTSVLLMMVLGPAWASPARAENSPAGVVTAVHGTATVTRASLPEPGPLKFRDSVFTRDRITTGDRSFARVLLGGKALVTARERSVLTITTVPGTATVEARSGKVAVAVAKSLNPSGETIAIRTRNAVVAVRGTVVIAEVVPGGAADGTQDRTVFTVLRGVVDVYGLDPTSGKAGPGRRLGALQRASFAGLAAPRTAPVTAAEAKRLAAEFTVPMVEAKTATSSVAQAHVAKAVSQIEGLLRPSGTSTSTLSSPSLSTTSLTGATSLDSGRLTSDSTMLRSEVLSPSTNVTIRDVLKSGVVREGLDSSTLESADSTLKTGKW